MGVVFAAELGALSQRMAYPMDVLLELNRRHGGDGAEVPLERGDAHRAQRGEVLDPQRDDVVVANPADRVADLGQGAVGEPGLADYSVLFTGEEPPQDLLLDQRREHGSVGGAVEQPQQAHQRVRRPGREHEEQGHDGGDPGRRAPDQGADGHGEQADHSREEGSADHRAQHAGVARLAWGACEPIRA
jgi:hypothetical protein